MLNFKLWLEVGDSPWNAEEKPPLEKLIKYRDNGGSMPKAYPPDENSDQVNPELPPAKRKFGQDKFKMRRR